MTLPSEPIPIEEEDKYTDPRCQKLYVLINGYGSWHPSVQATATHFIWVLLDPVQKVISEQRILFQAGFRQFLRGNETFDTDSRGDYVDGNINRSWKFFREFLANKPC